MMTAVERAGWFIEILPRCWVQMFPPAYLSQVSLENLWARLLFAALVHPNVLGTSVESHPWRIIFFARNQNSRESKVVNAPTPANRPEPLVWNQDTPRLRRLRRVAQNPFTNLPKPGHSTTFPNPRQKSNQHGCAPRVEESSRFPQR